MSGILDNKTRIMDTIVTLEGRRQMADGKLRIEYVSFTDNSTFYDPDVVSGSADPTSRLYFEQCHLPQDQITFEADDSGKIKPFKNKSGILALNGKILAKTVTQAVVGGPANEQIEILAGDEFASTANTLLASSIENFKNLYTVGTNDPLFLEDELFEVHPPLHQFSVNKNLPLTFSNYTKVLGSMPSLMNDEKLSNVINFQYLPPINKVTDSSIDKKDQNQVSDFEIGDYARLNPFDDYSQEELESDLSESESNGFKKSFKFGPTSIKNMLVTQFFELSKEELKKLDVIEYGSYKYKGSIRQVFFVGKVLVDEYDSDTFVRLFTLVFE